MYYTTLSDIKYVVTFVCLYSGLLECFANPSKRAENITYLLNGYSPVRSTLWDSNDNRTECVTRAMEETLKELNTNHVTTSFYHPQRNAKIERLHDCSPKQRQNRRETWNRDSHREAKRWKRWWKLCHKCWQRYGYVTLRTTKMIWCHYIIATTKWWYSILKRMKNTLVWIINVNIDYVIKYNWCQCYM